ncbi:peptidylprolyl isomerase [Nocardioides aquiterrae]|uniref:PPIase cyclophilin-type domain-containing protein n=1 Tax=Nocardioides aquiterrae TaxID=203799 RepID=A0ABN1UFL0_9ACTN
MLRRVVLPLAVLSALALAGCGSDGPDTTATEPSVQTTDCSYEENGQAAAKNVDPPSAKAPAEGTVDVTLKTSAGDIPITMDQASTPCAVNSFVSLAKQGYFDKTPCHRLTTQGIFVLQCGDPTGSGMGGPGYSFPDELQGDETYPAGTVAMANAGPDTNGSQFFLVYADTTLNPAAYDVIGQMDQAGIDVVKQVAAKGTQDGGPDGAPKETVTIESVTTD